jgi:hypothetical protein
LLTAQFPNSRVFPSRKFPSGGTLNVVYLLGDHIFGECQLNG